MFISFSFTLHFDLTFSQLKTEGKRERNEPKKEKNAKVYSVAVRRKIKWKQLKALPSTSSARYRGYVARSNPPALARHLPCKGGPFLDPLPTGYKGSRRGNESCDPVCLVLRARVRGRIKKGGVTCRKAGCRTCTKCNS